MLHLLLAPDIRLSSCPMATPSSSMEAGIRKTKEVRTNLNVAKFSSDPLCHDFVLECVSYNLVV